MAAIGLALALARGVEGGVALGLSGLGAGVLLFAVFASTRRRRDWAQIVGAEPAPTELRVESRGRSLAVATYPSTIGVTLVLVALWPDPRLAALLAGILAGLGVAALVFAVQLSAWERLRLGRILVERGRKGRVFLQENVL